MANNYLNEKLNSIRNEMSHIWGAMFVTGGGSITILTTDMNGLKTMLFIFGMVLTMLFLNYARRIYNGLTNNC